jgi:hypothetical protein
MPPKHAGKAIDEQVGLGRGPTSLLLASSALARSMVYLEYAMMASRICWDSDRLRSASSPVRSCSTQGNQPGHRRCFQRTGSKKDAQ